MALAFKGPSSNLLQIILKTSSQFDNSINWLCTTNGGYDHKDGMFVNLESFMKTNQLSMCPSSKDYNISMCVNMDGHQGGLYISTTNMPSLVYIVSMYKWNWLTCAIFKLYKASTTCHVWDFRIGMSPLWFFLTVFGWEDWVPEITSYVRYNNYVRPVFIKQCLSQYNLRAKHI